MILFKAFRTAVYQRIHADFPALRLFPMAAPQGTSYPYLVLSPLEATQERLKGLDTQDMSATALVFAALEDFDWVADTLNSLLASWERAELVIAGGREVFGLGHQEEAEISADFDGSGPYVMGRLKYIWKIETT